MRNCEKEIRIGLSAAAIFGALSGDFIKKDGRALAQTPIVRSAETLIPPLQTEITEKLVVSPIEEGEEGSRGLCGAIDLNWINQTRDEEINSLNRRLASAAPAEEGAIQRSIEIYRIEKEEYNNMDENKDGKIDSQEFNRRRGIIYARTYPLKHQKVENKPDGLYDENGNLVTPERLEQVKEPLTVIVEAGIFRQLEPYLNQYKLDLEQEGRYKVRFFFCNNCTKEEIKNLLISSNSSGVLMVGDLPTAWFRNVFDTASGMMEYVYPDDLYFMDLNGVWGGETPCLPWWKEVPVTCFTNHQGEINPEIIFGRLVSPVQDREIELLINYFRKNHDYRTGNFILPFRSLNYLQNSGEAGLRWVEAINRVYPIMETVDLPITSKRDYILRWQNGYEHLWVDSHASGKTQFFPDGIVTYVDVRDKKPKFHFYGLHGCSIANYTEQDCIGLWYVFQNSNYGLLATGATKITCIYDYEKFYNSLAESQNFGEAFREQFRGNAWDRWCFGGFTFLGDPTLKIFPRQEKPLIFFPFVVK